MLKFENINKIEGLLFHNGRYLIYKCEDSLVKTYIHIRDLQSPFTQTIELKKEANPVYTLYNSFNKTTMYLDLETIKDVNQFLKKIEAIIDTSVTWQ